jgi:hypothetical protein
VNGKHTDCGGNLRGGAGNLTYNVEFDGILLPSSAQANSAECYNLCKNYQGVYFFQAV